MKVGNDSSVWTGDEPASRCQQLVRGVVRFNEYHRVKRLLDDAWERLRLRTSERLRLRTSERLRLSALRRFWTLRQQRRRERHHRDNGQSGQERSANEVRNVNEERSESDSVHYHLLPVCC